MAGSQLSSIGSERTDGDNKLSRNDVAAFWELINHSRRRAPGPRRVGTQHTRRFFVLQVGATGRNSQIAPRRRT